MNKLSDKNVSGFLPLGFFGKMYRGVSYNAEEDLRNTETPCTVRLLRANNVQDGEIVFDDIQIIDRKCVKETQLLQTGDILVCMANGSRDLVGKAAQFNDKERLYTFGAFMGCFRTKNVNDSNYISYLLQSTKYRKYITILLAGSSINNLRPSDIESMEFQFPTDAERQMIVSCLQDVDKQISSTQHLLTKYESIKKATVKKLITPTSEWQEARLGDFYTVTSGLSKGAASFGRGYPFLSFVTVFNNPIVPEKLDDLVESSEYERRQYSVKRGDVFLTRTSETLDELGMSSVALQDYSEATFNGFTKRLRPVDSIPLCPEFMAFYLRTDNFRRHICQKTAITTRASLNKDTIEKLEIFFPSPIVQREISANLIALDNQRNSLCKELVELQQLKQSMLHYFFSN